MDAYPAMRPGTAAIASRRDLVGFGILYAVAFLVRFYFFRAPPYGDEGIHYFIAKHWWVLPTNVDDVYNHVAAASYSPYFFQRPGFYVFMRPSAMISFEAFRFWHLVFAAMLPVAATLLLRTQRVRPLLAYGAGLLVVAAPPFVIWGSRVMTDSLMTLAAAMAVFFFVRKRPEWAAAATVGAAWIKETAVVLALLLLVASGWEDVRRRSKGLKPFPLSRGTLWLMAAVPLCMAPAALSVHLGAALPGGPGVGYALRLLDQVTLTAWLFPIILAGLLWPRTRPWSALGLAFPLFFLGIHMMLHRSVEAWYLVPSAFFAVITTAVVLDAFWNGQISWAGRRAGRVAPVLAVGVAFLFAVQLLAPVSAFKERVTHPVWGHADTPITDQYPFERKRNQDYLEALTHAQPGPGRTLFLVDVYLALALYPASEKTQFVRVGDTVVTAALGWEIAPWAAAIGSEANATLVEKRDSPLNAAVLEVYHDCVTYDEDRYVVLEGRSCAGRGPELEKSYEVRQNATRTSG